MNRVQADLDNETWLALERLARESGRTVEELANQAFADLLTKHRRPQKGASHERRTDTDQRNPPKPEERAVNGGRVRRRKLDEVPTQVLEAPLWGWKWPVSDRRTAPAPERNKEPILAVLRRVLPESGLVLEIASGTGQHVVHFAQGLPALEWQPSDPDPEARSSITAWIAHEGVSNVRQPVDLDVGKVWPIGRADAVVCINMLHVAPWAATSQLLTGAAQQLPVQGVLYLYGPFRQADRQTAASNESFDSQLKQHNPEWGLRDLEMVVEIATKTGFQLAEVTEMPANNLSVVFRRAGE